MTSALFKTLKGRLIAYFLAITIIPSAAIGYFYFKNSQHTLEKNMIDTSVSSLDYSITLIDKQLQNASQLSDWIFINKNLDSILTKDYAGQGFGYDSDVETFLELLQYQLRFNASVGTYVYSLLIHGENGMDLRAGQPEGSQINLAELEEKDWFQQGVSLQGRKSWYGVVENPSAVKVVKLERYILPMVRPVLHSFTNREIGWHMIGFRTTLISDLFRDLEIRPDETLMVTDPRGFCVYHNKPTFIGQSLGDLEYIRTILSGDMLRGHINTRIDDAARLVVFARSASTGWSIVKVLSSSELGRQKQILLLITFIILLSSLVVTTFFAIYLSSNLTHPLTKILRRTKAIAAGDFTPDPSIEGDDELGVLGREINAMSANIGNLLDRTIADEREKRRLELEVLQNQVNPHFLYNTLNSLKLMATIQKADGIRQIVTALGRLLMYLSKNTSETITLEEEISLLNDYVYIQNIRYRGKIKLDYHLEKEDYLRCRIIKFTLQPIVENAIFHGIEPKKDAGRIRITVSERDDRLIICIEDDGVGMTSEQIRTILTAPPETKRRGLSGIGVKNVNERIRLAYGQEYGLSIESSVGEYTRVYLEIPMQIA